MKYKCLGQGQGNLPVWFNANIFRIDIDVKYQMQTGSKYGCGFLVFFYHNVKHMSCYFVKTFLFSPLADIVVVLIR